MSHTGKATEEMEDSNHPPDDSQDSSSGEEVSRAVVNLLKRCYGEKEEEEMDEDALMDFEEEVISLIFVLIVRLS